MSAVRHLPAVARVAMVRGWCPDAWHPMPAGDGLLVRVRPRLGRLSRAQWLSLCAASIAYGNGAIDATNRANLQIRGVREESWRPLVAELIASGLIDPDPVREARSNILVAPDWRAGDDTHRIAEELLARRDSLPDLPSKIGFVIDAGRSPMLRKVSGDFRIERCAAGGLIVRADGREGGAPVRPDGEADALIALARWFVDTGGARAGRMIRHMAPLPDWASAAIPPAEAASALRPGPQDIGIALGIPFGRIEASELAGFLEGSDVRAARVTPWRILIFEGTAFPHTSLFIGDPASPLIEAHACVGAPACPQASVETRQLAHRLAPHVDGRLHVSGCAKGCAHAGSAAVILTGRDGRFDLGFDGRAGDTPARAGLDADQILAHFGAR